MGLVNAPVSMLPTIMPFQGSNSDAVFTFDTSTDLIAVVIRIPKTGTIDKVHYRIVGVTSPVMTHRISLQTVDATTGLPTGTLYGGGTAITVDASTYGANTNYTAAVNVSATAGDVVAIVFDLSAFTSGSFTMRSRVGFPAIGSVYSGVRTVAFPYDVYNTAGSAAKGQYGLSFNSYGLEYSGAVYEPAAFYCSGMIGSGTQTTVTNSGDTRVGNRFRPVVPRRAIGIWACANAPGNVVFRLRLQSDDSILATATVDKDQAAFSDVMPCFFLFDSGATVNLTAGVDYYITMEGSDGTGGSLGGISSMPSQASQGWLPGGSTCYGTVYNGSYSDSTTARYGIGLITDQEDDGSGGGGGLLTNPGMSGGLRG